MKKLEKKLETREELQNTQKESLFVRGAKKAANVSQGMAALVIVFGLFFLLFAPEKDKRAFQQRLSESLAVETTTAEVATENSTDAPTVEDITTVETVEKKETTTHKKVVEKTTEPENEPVEPVIETAEKIPVGAETKNSAKKEEESTKKVKRATSSYVPNRRNKKDAEIGDPYIPTRTRASSIRRKTEITTGEATLPAYDPAVTGENTELESCAPIPYETETQE